MSEHEEKYSVAEIRAAFDRHASPDDWGVPSFYVGSLLGALRGEYDDPPVDEAQVEALADDLIGRDAEDVSYLDRDDAMKYARRLVENGWTKP